MRSLCLAVCRFSLAAWVGAAVLFIVVSIGEINAFDSEMRERLVLIRFPFYYPCGFGLVLVSLASGFASRKHAALSSRQANVFLGLVLVALLTMVADYIWVYRPLVEMMTRPGGAKPSTFVSLHELTKWINFGNLTLCLIASLVICWPQKLRTEPVAQKNPRT
jgi:hypothetical protein